MRNCKVYLISLGCPKNLVDSERVLSYFEGQGFNIVPDIKNSNIVLINTCSFIKDARKESSEVIKKCIKWKNKKPNQRKVVVFGCLPQLKGKEIIKKFPHIDGLLGVEPYNDLEKLIKNINNHNCFINIENVNINKDNYKGRLLGRLPHSTYLKIAEGCDRSCTFCVIPKIRGPYRSRPPKDILLEAKALAELGTKEIILIAEDTTLYGKDLKIKINLAKLVKMIAKIKGIEWIRLLYLYPDGITKELIDVIANEEKVCKYIDMPLQHINSRIIKKMKRGMERKKIVKLIKKMREKIKGLSIRTAFIVGFPGESNVEFKQLLEFLDQIKFDHVGFFAYSNEKEAMASKFEGQIREADKKARLKKAYQRQRKISLENNKKMAGQKVQVLVDASGIGRTYGSAPDIDSLVCFKAEEKVQPGSFASVLITSSSDYYLKGVLVT